MDVPMKTPPIVSPQEWEAARQQLLVKEKALTRARDALAAERRRMPWTAVEKQYDSRRRSFRIRPGAAARACGGTSWRATDGDTCQRIRPQSRFSVARSAAPQRPATHGSHGTNSLLGHEISTQN